MDRHHVIFNKREWESRPQYKSLRENEGLIVPMDRDIHNELHRAVPFVPVMGYYGIMAVQREFYRDRTRLGTIENLMFAIEKSMEHPKLSDIERSLAGLALQAVDVQRPFIRQGEIGI